MPKAIRNLNSPRYHPRGDGVSVHISEDQELKMPTEIDVRLRPVKREDLEVFFRHQSDPVANELSKVYPRSRVAFDSHWDRVLRSPEVTVRSILFSGEVAGCINCFQEERSCWVGYWIGREHWGNGIATAALSQMLRLVKLRPIKARVAIDNVGSLRVLEKCGFAVVDSFDSSGTERYMACREVLLSLEDRVDRDTHQAEGVSFG